MSPEEAGAAGRRAAAAPGASRAGRALGAVLLAAAAGAVVLAAARFADGPVGPLPGGRLRGAEDPRPAAGWAFAEGARTLALEVGGPEAWLPTSVTTWFVVHEGRLVVTADFMTPFKRWPRRAILEPRARVRVAGRIRRVRLARVEDPERRAALRRAVARKYGLDERSWLARVPVWFFEAEPRP